MGADADQSAAGPVVKQRLQPKPIKLSKPDPSMVEKFRERQRKRQKSEAQTPAPKLKVELKPSPSILKKKRAAEKKSKRKRTLAISIARPAYKKSVCFWMTFEKFLEVKRPNVTGMQAEDLLAEDMIHDQNGKVADCRDRGKHGKALWRAELKAKSDQIYASLNGKAKEDSTSSRRRLAGGPALIARFQRESERCASS